MAKNALVVGFLLCAFTSLSLRASELTEIRGRGTLRMLSFPHIESLFVKPDLDALRASGGPLTELRDPSAYGGVDVEIISAFAAHLGVELEIVPVVTTYGDLLQALLDGRGDLVASSLTITEERRRRVDFSHSYARSWIVAGVLAGSEIRSLEDLGGRRAAVMRGSSQLEYLEQLEIPDLQLVLTDYALENTEALESGRADFALFDSSSPVGELVQEGLSEAIVAFRLRPFDYGYAMRPGSDLRGELDRFIEQLRASGRLAEMTKNLR